MPCLGTGVKTLNGPLQYVNLAMMWIRLNKGPLHLLHGNLPMKLACLPQGYLPSLQGLEPLMTGSATGICQALCQSRGLTVPLVQGVCLAFMREPLIDWQREGQRVADVRLRSSRTPSNSSAAVAESAQNEHLQLKVGPVCI